MAEDDNILLDSSGKPADKKFAFELERKILGRVVRGFRFHSNEPYGDEGKRGITIVMSFEDGGDMMFAVEEPGKLEILVSMTPTPDLNESGGRVM